VRTISTTRIRDVVKELCLAANFELPSDVASGMEWALQTERSELGRRVLAQLRENAALARRDSLAMCQDTGLVVVFIDVGQDVHLEGLLLEDAVNEGVRLAYREGFFRCSIVNDPLQRINTEDNTPAVVHTRIVVGDKVHIYAVPKGFGSENMSRLAMLKPSQGRRGVLDFVVETVSMAGGNPCPPIMVGVGLGGTMEKAAELSKRSLLLPVGQRHQEPHLAALERDLLEAVNRLGIGAQGFGGTVTALDVHVLTAPTHIAGLPVAVNINCHAARHGEAVL